VEKLILKSIILFSILALAACNSADLEDVNGIESNTIVSGSFDQYDNAKISGTGRVRFESTATGDRTALALQAALDDSLNTSSVSAHFYSPSLILNPTTGVVVTFTRNGAGVTGQIAVNGTSRDISASCLSFFFPTSLDLIIEVHNSGTRSRVLIWRRDLTIYTADNADVDTERSGNLVGGTLSGVGSGLYWGLSLNLSTVSAAQSSAPQVPN
jgi:hypothetical protein